MEKRFHTSESTTSGHPDKICDQIADAIVDEMIKQDIYGRCGCEVLVNANLVVVSGEFKTHALIDVPNVVRTVLHEIGYTNPSYGFMYNGCSIITTMRLQSSEIAAVIDQPDKKKVGASDQALILGYATNETKELMPLPILLANQLVKQLDYLRKTRTIPYLRPDGKAQVTIEYQKGIPKHITNIVVAAQHEPEIPIEQIRMEILEQVIRPTAPPALLNDQTKIIINNLGRFIEGGPKIDTGVTGRKIVNDTYGGAGFIGGGALSGKDPSKIDRVAAYYGRYIAKNVVAAGLAQRCEVEIAYAFGVIDPVSTVINTFGTANISEEEILKRVLNAFNFQPESMIKDLNLRRPIYQQTAAYGAFGWQDYPWESTDKADNLRF